jgi:hypothetical protein
MHKRHLRLLTLVLATNGLLWVNSASRANTILYSQPNRGYGFAFSYGTPAGGQPDTAYENFTLSSDARIGTVSWAGTYVNFAGEKTEAATTPNTVSFAISFLADNGGKPGAVLGTTTIPLADLSIRSAGVDDTFFSNHYTASLPTPFKVTGGRPYWIEIFSNSTSDEPAWAWQAGLGADEQCYAIAVDKDPNGYIEQGTGLQSFPIALTFALGTPLPAPTITVAATVAEAQAGQPGLFKFTSSTPPTTDIVIHYMLEGTAVDGQDYKFLNGTKKIKAYHTSVSIKVVPKTTRDIAKKSKVKLVLEPASGYLLGTPKAETIEILEP